MKVWTQRYILHISVITRNFKNNPKFIVDWRTCTSQKLHMDIIVHMLYPHWACCSKRFVQRSERLVQRSYRNGMTIVPNEDNWHNHCISWTRIHMEKRRGERLPLGSSLPTKTLPRRRWKRTFKSKIDAIFTCTCWSTRKWRKWRKRKQKLDLFEPRSQRCGAEQSWTRIIQLGG